MTTRKRARKGARTLIVDRWIGRDVARVELDGEPMEVPRALLPADAEPETAMRIERSRHRVVITLDPEGTAAARRDAERLVSKLKGRDRGGSVTL